MPFNRAGALRLLLGAFAVDVVGPTVFVLSPEQLVLPGWLIVLLVLSPLFAVGSVEFARRMLVPGPGLVIDRSGFENPRDFVGKIPWSEITAIERLSIRGGGLTSGLAPDSAANIRRRGLFRFWPGRRSVSIVFTTIGGQPDFIASQIETRWQAARTPRGVASTLEKSDRIVAIAAARPRLVYVLMALLGAIYACELLFPVSAGRAGDPSVLTLAYDGGMLRLRVLDHGEWRRLLTAARLHGGPNHILTNGVVLWFAGGALERLVGWRWMLGIFAVSALGGSLASLILLQLHVVGVGASGAIMGLLTCVIVVGFRLPISAQRIRLQTRMVMTIVPALFPFFSHPAGMNVDYSAHAGGAFAGAPLGVLLLTTWPREQSEPPRAGAALVVGVAFWLTAAGALWPILNRRGVL